MSDIAQSTSFLRRKRCGWATGHQLAQLMARCQKMRHKLFSEDALNNLQEHTVLGVSGLCQTEAGIQHQQSKEPR